MLKIKKQTKKEKLVSVLLWPWFVFLLAVLVYIAVLQSDHDIQKLRLFITQEMEHTAEHIEDITSTGQRNNRFFIQAYQEELENLVNGKPNSSSFWYSVGNSFRGHQGFFIYSENGEAVFEKSERSAFLKEEFRSSALQDTTEGILTRKPEDSIFYYIYSKFQVNEQYYFLIIKYHVDNALLTHVGLLPDELEVSLISDKNSQVLHTTLKNKGEEFNEFVVREIVPLDWRLVVHQHQDYQLKLLFSHLVDSFVVLLFFLLFYAVLWFFIKQNQKKYRELGQLKDRMNRQGKKMLDSIDEIIIHTNDQGVITYLNNQAMKFLGGQSPELLGRFLHIVYPNDQAIWNKHNQDKEALEIGYLEVKKPSGNLFYEQRSQTLKVSEDKQNHLWVLRDVTEKKRYLDLLEKGKQRYQSIFEGSGSAHALIKRTNNGKFPFVIVDANHAALKLFDIDGFDDFLFNAQSLLEKNHTFIKCIEKQTDSDEFQAHIVSLTDKVKDVWAHVHIGDYSHEDHILLTLVDITERNQLLKQSMERENFWERIMEAIPDLVYVAEFDDTEDIARISYKNTTVEALLGHDERDISAQSWKKHLSADELSGVQNSIYALRKLKPKQKYNTTLKFYDVSQQLRHVRFQSSIFETDKDGNVKSVIGLARDITESVNRQQKIIDSEKHYSLVAENINDVIWSTDTELNLTFISASVERMFGHSSQYLIEKGLQNIFPLDIRSQLLQGLARQIELAQKVGSGHKNSNVQDVSIPHANGDKILVELQTDPLFENGELVGILGICRDVTQVRKSQQELKLAAKVFESSNEAIIITDKHLNVVSSNKSFTKITGYSGDQALGQSIEFLIASKDKHPYFFQEVNKRLTDLGYWQGEVFYTCAKKHQRIGWVGISAIKDENKKIQSLIMIVSDITERKAIEERIHHLAYYDPLTGLPNRTYLHEKLDYILASAQTKTNNVVLLFIDLDRFKPINDSMGHPVGDQVLKQVAERLKGSTKSHDLVCRIGGDEFTVIIENQGSTEIAVENSVAIAERILANLNKPYFINNRELFLTASIGIAIYPSDGLSVTELIKNSDLAMYHAKNTSRGSIQFFNESMNKVAVEAMELENDLRHALSNGEFELYYQPQYSSCSCEMASVEALIRWHHPTKGMISPALFIPSLEETGMIVEVGRWVLEEACRQFSIWLKDEDANFEHVSVNVSARQFKQEDFIHQIHNALLKANIKPSNLEIELTESVLVDNIDNTFKTLSGLRDLGIKVAIDDFGTGYSSLNYLKRFPFDTLKIDQSFVRELPDNQDDAQITRAIIALAKNMKVEVVAEGVETKAQFHFLSEQNCNKIQGYLFERPLPAKELLEKFLRDKRDKPYATMKKDS